ncbi:MAG: hypothetical protein J0I10_20055 [Verrucomicrobia bacterium]|nr:hypothetical protein [Verrucomicrobiota bacterium]
MNKILAGCVAVLVVWSAACEAQERRTEFFFSGPGYVSAGRTELLTTAEYDFVAQLDDSTGINFTMTGLQALDSWSVDVGTADGSMLQVGLYTGATRYPFNLAPHDGLPTTPGLSFSGDGRGANDLTGWFRVLEAEYSVETGVVTAFAVDFFQIDDGVEGGWNVGSLRYNSTVPTNLDPVPEPSACALLGIAAGSLLVWRGRGRALAAWGR